MGINNSVHKKMLGLFIIRYYINKSRNLIDNLSCMKCFGWQTLLDYSKYFKWYISSWFFILLLLLCKT